MQGDSVDLDGEVEREWRWNPVQGRRREAAEAAPEAGKTRMPKQNDADQLMKQRFVTVYEVHSGKLTATKGAERLGVSRKTFYEYMDAFLTAAVEALTPGNPGRPKLSPEIQRIRQLETEKKKLEEELYEARAVSELQSKIIAIRDSQLAEREKKRK